MPLEASKVFFLNAEAMLIVLETGDISGSGLVATVVVVIAVVVTAVVVVVTTGVVAGRVVDTVGRVVVVAAGVVLLVVSAVVVALSPQETAVRITQNSAIRTKMIESFFMCFPF